MFFNSVNGKCQLIKDLKKQIFDFQAFFQEKCNKLRRKSVRTIVLTGQFRPGMGYL